MHSSAKLHGSLVWLLLLLTLSACHQDSAPAAGQTSTAKESESSEKRYHLEGQVISTDKQSKMVNVDSQAIPGFMDAMTMPYAVKPESELERLSPGDRITADVVVRDGNTWLEKIVVRSHPANPASK